MKIALRFIVAGLFLALIGFGVYYFFFRLSNEETIVNAVVEYKEKRDKSNLDANLEELKNLGIKDKNGVDITDKSYNTLRSLVLANGQDGKDEYLTYVALVDASDLILDYYYVASRVLDGVSTSNAKEIKNKAEDLINKGEELSKLVKQVYNNQKLTNSQPVNGSMDGTLLALTNQYSNLEVKFREYLKLYSSLNMSLEKVVLDNVYDNGAYFSEIGALTQFVNYAIDDFVNKSYSSIIDEESINADYLDNMKKCSYAYAKLLEKNQPSQGETVGNLIVDYNEIKLYDKTNELNNISKILDLSYSKIVEFAKGSGSLSEISSAITPNLKNVLKLIYEVK